MLLPISLLMFMSSADLLMMASAFRVFDELDITITEANTTWRKSPTRGPDLYLDFLVSARKPDGSMNDHEVHYFTSYVMKNSQHAVFNQLFPYVRAEDMRYTFGTDNVITILLMDQGLAYADDTLLARFQIDLNDVVQVPNEEEQIVTIHNETLSITSTVGYKICHQLHEETKDDPQLDPDIRADDYEAEDSESPLFHIHHVRHADGSVEAVTPDFSFSYHSAST